MVALSALSAAIYVGAFWHVRRRPAAGRNVLQLTFWLLVTSGLIQLGAAAMGAQVARYIAQSTGKGASIGVGFSWQLQIFVTHLLACLFLPWTPRECFRPLIPLLAVNALFTLVSGDDWLVKALSIALSPLVGAPGALICWWRHSRFRDRFNQRMIKGRYLEMRRELVDARRIHEALFPPPIRSGPLRFDYVYEPMRQIGGDYLHACFSPARSGGPRALNLVVIDVTGHGIPAALTVNRLHGELERIFAEQPQVAPGEVLRLLNSYVHLTLAGHSVYVTALCVRVDPAADALEYASGGHPPAFLRGVDGTLEQLASTAFVLGACPGEDFRSDQRSVRFGEGDTLIAYTDGAIEARDRTGRYFGIAGLQRVLATTAAPQGSGWPALVTRAVDQHRFGPIADDTLVVEVQRPVPVGPPKGAAARTLTRAGA
jgi:serine phosphatase RsbU (regulator of sigma subunit)